MPVSGWGANAPLQPNRCCAAPAVWPNRTVAAGAPHKKWLPRCQVCALFDAEPNGERCYGYLVDSATSRGAVHCPVTWPGNRRYRADDEG